MKKRTLGALLALLLLCSLLPLSALADGSCGENVSWSLSDDGVLTLSGAGDMADFECGDAPWYAQRDKLRSVVVASGVTAIGSAAFSGCGLIQELTLPATLRRIGDGAFDDTYALRRVYYEGSIAGWKAIDIGIGLSFGSAELICADRTEPFSDISGWYRDYIVTCYMADIVNGCGDGTFRPEQKVTRAQFVMMLYNMGGRPEVSDTSLGFADAAQVQPVYAAAVKWGVRAGVVKGYDDNTFRPDENISRAQMAAFAYRFLRLGVSDTVLSQAAGSSDFRDNGSIPDYFREAVGIMAALGVIQGYPDGSFDPGGLATRGQSAAVMARLLTALTELREQ